MNRSASVIRLKVASILTAQLCFAVFAWADDDVTELVGRIRAAGAQAAGSAEARVARDKLAAMRPAVLPDLLDGMDTLDTVAANWLRTAFDEIVHRALRSERSSIPDIELHRFMLDAKRQGRVRRLALEVLSKLDATAAATLLPPLLDDPEFRRDAVAIALSEAEQSVKEMKTEQAVAAFSKAFDSARDVDQVRLAATKLKSLGREVSIVEHMGLLVDWHVMGPFDGPNFKAFKNVYPPEREIKLDATYDAQGGKVSWKRHHTPDEFGTVDLVKAVAAVDDAAAYAYTTVDSSESRDAQIRGGADDNLTIWLNGKKVFAKEEWQNGTRLDRFIAPVQLRKGTNEILVKVCQGPKYQDPGMANAWSMQIRICDATGKAIVLHKPSK